MKNNKKLLRKRKPCTHYYSNLKQTNWIQTGTVSKIPEKELKDVISHPSSSQISISYSFEGRIRYLDFYSVQEAIKEIKEGHYKNKNIILMSLNAIKGAKEIQPELMKFIIDNGNRCSFDTLKKYLTKRSDKPSLVSDKYVDELLNNCRPSIVKDADTGLYSTSITSKIVKVVGVNEDDESFKKEYLQIENNLIHDDIDDCYIGVDFGTSFTKIAYHLGPQDKGIIKFGTSYFKSTVVYYDDEGRLFLFKPNSEKIKTKKIKYFKCTMVNNSNLYSELRYKDLHFSKTTKEASNIFETLCSVFFLSNMFFYAANYLSFKYEIDCNFYVAMGYPLSNKDSDGEYYKKALHAALYIYKLRKKGQISDLKTITLDELFDYYLEAMDNVENPFDGDNYDPNPNKYNENCIIPELFTEAIYVIRSRQMDVGFYFIIDIGGGTTDFAVIDKTSSNSQFTLFHYYCPSAVITHLGNEVRKKEYDRGLRRDYDEKFSKSFYTTVGVAKLASNIKGPFTIIPIFFGGGSLEKGKPYQEKTKNLYQQYLNQISCKCITDEGLQSMIQSSINKNDYIDSIENKLLKKSDQQRLIIASQLADPETRDFYLSSFPSNYKSVKQSIGENNSYFERIRKDLGYEPSWF